MRWALERTQGQAAEVEAINWEVRKHECPRTRELQDARRAGGTALDLSGFTGLSEDDACRKIEQDGPNEIASQQKRGLLEIVIEVIREPMFLMLVAAGTLYLLMGSPGDALMLLGFVFVVMAITIIQERRTERALDALRDLSSPRALVIRGGLRRRVAGREVVRGDILVLSEGDRVPADAILRRAINLSVDESLLTGESVPVRKTPSADAQGLERPGGDDLPSVYSGTLVTAGQGIAEVVNTGGRTELGKIGKALQQIQPEATSLQKETGRMVRTLALVGLAACGLVVVMYALTRGGTAQVWKEGLLAGIAMAMAILPEEFPVVLTIFLALGAWRISRSRVLTRRMPAIETLGAATVLCVDKTGTLTRNQMTLKKLAIDGRTATIGADIANLSEEFHALLENAILASKRDPFDPMELALQAAGDRLLMQTEHLHPEWSLLREYPLTPQLLAVSQVWKLGAGEDVVVASKGAPEAIAELCRLSPDGRAAVAGEAAALAAEGLRVLGVACARLTVGSLPGEHSQLALEFLGLVGLEDPLRATVPAAVAECRTAGIRIVMITGDYPATAQSIARQAGLENPEKVLTGPELERMSDEELAKQTQGRAGICPRRTRAEAAHRNSPKGKSRDRRHDRRRRQRRSGAQGRPHRHRDGWPRHGRRTRSGIAGTARRRFLVHRGGGAPRAAYFRQHQEGHRIHLRGPHPDRRPLNAASLLLRLAAAAVPRAYCLSGADHRSLLLPHLRSGGGRGQRNEASAAKRQ